ncbi:alpha/beta fold hydrolase [Streptomyces sp. NPDC018031]|uniref:alpha/beta fold hydrolase n=1 Tax=Streptomyces sp. NPDC018031 TaxID=3365033 RepID=UPI0037A45A40
MPLPGPTGGYRTAVAGGAHVSRLRTPLALALAALLAAPLAPPGRAAASPSVSVTTLAFTVEVGGRRCTIDADLHRPAGVDASHRAPAVLTTNGFGGSKTDRTTGAFARALASRGYVTLAWSGLGFGRSGCPISLDDPEIDGRAAARLVGFLGGTVAADDGTTTDIVLRDRPGDPRVGMIGASYGGAVQLATAAVDHRVDALVPFVTWHDLAHSLAPNAAEPPPGGSATAPGVYKYRWARGFFRAGELRGLVRPGPGASRAGAGGCLHFVAEACRTLRLLASGRYPAARAAPALAYARGVSPVSYLHRVTAPTLLVQGQADTLFPLDEAAATYRALRARGTETKMIWQSWGHSGGSRDPAPGELDLARGNWETSYVGRRVLAWFDHHLRHRAGADTGPAFAYYRDWVRSGPRYAGAAGFPVGTARRLHLSGDGRLVERRDEVRTGTRGYRNRPLPTSHSERPFAATAGLPDRAPYDAPGTHLGWTTDPLPGALDVVGMPKLSLEVASPRAERAGGSGDAADRLVLFAKLYDVAPDGTRSLIHRLVAPVRVPDVTRPFTVALPGIAHRFGAGHRLSLVIAASDTAHYGNRGVKPVAISSAPDAAGVLELPVTGPAPG